MMWNTQIEGIGETLAVQPFNRCPRSEKCKTLYIYHMEHLVYKCVWVKYGMASFLTAEADRLHPMRV